LPKSNQILPNLPKFYPTWQNWPKFYPNLPKKFTRGHIPSSYATDVIKLKFEKGIIMKWFFLLNPFIPCNYV